MLQKKLRATVCLALTFTAIAAVRAADAPKKRDINLDDLAKFQRVGSLSVSPDGEWVVYTVSQVDTKEDKTQSHLWMAKWDGSVRLQLTYGKEGASAPKFSPDGRYISFTSSRPGTVKGDQVWVMWTVAAAQGGAASVQILRTKTSRAIAGRRTRKSCCSRCIPKPKAGS